ncbi:PH domain-containing protein [Solirubrobacter deserti]|uniref:PH domain-containing protein n=1 Tax=Solirubrobacter deserti TaxID=2282478 RepID=A0ABT4RSD0_9ACTN|nr:PH domain-containing protein [Solirubrobacter deserti]MDA0141499.1 PH domain-containing protein [Solirubrobacter deserti]
MHPAALVVYSAAALRQGLFPLLIIVVMPLLGGEFEARELVRAAAFAGAGLVIAGVSGYVRWSTTRWWIDEAAVHHHTGLLRRSETKVPLERIEGLDVHQGPLQRAFGVFAVDVQTGAGKKGGEVALPALAPEAVEDLRAARLGAVPVAAVEETGRSRRLTGRELAITALTAGQLGVLVPVVAALGQVVGQVGESEQEDAVRFLPQSVTAAVLVVVGLLALAWLLSIAGSVIAFGGFTLVRDQERLRVRRGLISRNEATVPVGRVRAVRVVEGLLRRPFGLCALTVEVTGYADEASAARTLFPVLRVRDVRAFLDEFLPEFADELVVERPPRRALRRYVLVPALVALALTIGGWLLLGPWSVIALVVSLYGWARWRDAGWHVADGRLAVRSLLIARTTVLAPARLRESHTVSQNPFQRRAQLATLAVAFGKSTTARIRHLEATDARSALRDPQPVQ